MPYTGKERIRNKGLIFVAQIFEAFDCRENMDSPKNMFPNRMPYKPPMSVSAS